MESTLINLHQQIFSCESRDEKKQLLKSLSIEAKGIIETEAPDLRVNDILIQMYSNEEHQEFNNFWEWKKKGFKVKKGAKAFFVWSKKRKGTEKPKNESDDEKEFSFFSLAYLFSNAQVEPLKQKA